MHRRRLGRRFLGLAAVAILLDDLGDGDVGLDLDPVVAVVFGLGTLVGVGLTFQYDVGRAEMDDLGSK